MSREPDPSNNQQAFLLSALQQGLRLDGRPLDAYRPISLSFGDDYGSSDVRLGKTRVLAKISCEVTAPYTDRKFDGIFTINCELSPIASPAFEIGRYVTPSCSKIHLMVSAFAETCQRSDTSSLLLSRLLEKALRRSGALDTESLCIIAGQKCFHLRADLHVLDHDGNLVDASCLALVAALLHFRRPDFEVHGEDATVFSTREREPVKLTIQHRPFCVTFSLFRAADASREGEIMLQDATLFEEQCRDDDIVICMNRFGEVCQIAKYGGTPVDGLSILTCTNVASGRVKAFDRLVGEELKADEERRDAGGLMAELSAENDRPIEPPVG